LLANGWYFSPGTPASSTTKTDRYDIIQIFNVTVDNIQNIFLRYLELHGCVTLPDANGGGQYNTSMQFKIPVSSTSKTGRHDIAEILLKVALKHQKSNQSMCANSSSISQSSDI